MKRPSKLPIAVAASALVGILGAADVASAHSGGFDAFSGIGAKKFLRLLQDLDLTEEQELKAVRLRRKLRKEHKENRAALRADMDAVMSELEKPQPDGAKIRSTVDAAMERMRSTAHQAIDAFLELHATLTPEQRTAIQTRASEVRERINKRRERRRRHRRHERQVEE